MNEARSENTGLRDNVIYLQRRHPPELTTPHGYTPSDDSLTGRRPSPKENVEVISKVAFEKPTLPFERRHYPTEYNSWRNMKQRCKAGDGVLDPRFKKFQDFIRHMSQMPGKGYTLDRIDFTNPEYSPENCRWASKSLQTQNRSNTSMLTDNTGICRPASEW